MTIGYNATLKSGGPTMTVTRHLKSGTAAGADLLGYECSWFTDGILHKGEFPKDAVKLSKTD